MKKTLLIIAAVSAVILTSCAKKEAASNAPKEITIWCWDPQFNIYAMNHAAAIYNADHPDVTINVVETPWDDVQQKLITSLSANDTKSLPDIVLMQDNALQKNITNYPKAFLPLNGKMDLSKFAQYKVVNGEVDGKQYAVPFDNAATATFLRKSAIEKAGLTADDFTDITWSKFIELGKKVKEASGLPLLTYQADSHDAIMIMAQSANTWFFDADGKVNLNHNPIIKEAVDTYVELVKSGVCELVTDWSAYIGTLNNSTVAGTIEGSWIMGSIFMMPDQKNDWVVTNTPKLDNVSSATNYSSQGGSSWLVMASSKNADLAVDFLDKTYGGSTQFYDEILEGVGAIGTWAPAAGSSKYSMPVEFFGGDQVYKKFVEYAGKVPQVKYGVFNYEAGDAVGTAVTKAIGGMDVQAALDEAQKNVEFMMGS